jgi:hypothetical protein
LPADALEVKLEFLNAQGRVIRAYSTADPVRNPDPAIDPAAYNKLCQETPSKQDCGLPLYWPAPPKVLGISAGMHRFIWDLRYDPVPGTPGARGGSGGEVGAVPHRTDPNLNSPWVPPGGYTVRLTVNGQSMTQPITIRMDPRVKVTPALQRVFTLTGQMENEAASAASLRKEARALVDKLKAGPQSATSEERVPKLEEIAPEPASAQSPAEGRRTASAAEETSPTLTDIGGRLVGSVMPMQAADMPATAAELTACAKQQAAYTALMAKWAALKVEATKE